LGEGERRERCQWQIQRPERVAGVGEGRRRTVAKDIRRAPQQERRMRHSSSLSAFLELLLLAVRWSRRGKSRKCKEIIKRHAIDFGGTLSDKEVMTLCQISRNSYYKYKRELKTGDYK